MRIVIAGSGSLIAQAVAQEARVAGHAYTAVRHDQDLAGLLRPDDVLMNFAIAPDYRTGTYNEALDCDLCAARLATEAGAGFVMLSTRRVYGPDQRWNATETADTQGDETAYGRNKAQSEKLVQQVCRGHAGIFRLSNVFGYEYNNSPAPRHSFLGKLLYTLKRQNKIFFDMHPTTKRDFIPLQTCASLLVARAADRTAGIYNLGCGFGINCGELARWVMEGFGDGELICDPMIVRDEFCLDMNHWRVKFALPVDRDMIRDHCKDLGERLKCEKS